MPGARFFFLSHAQPFVLPDGRAGGGHYNWLRRAAVLPLLPAALYSSSWIFMQHHNNVGFRVWCRTGAIGCFWPYRTFGYARSWI